MLRALLASAVLLSLVPPAAAIGETRAVVYCDNAPSGLPVNCGASYGNRRDSCDAQPPAGLCSYATGGYGAGVWFYQGLPPCHDVVYCFDVHLGQGCRQGMTGLYVSADNQLVHKPGEWICALDGNAAPASLP
ncbi:MAG TPA: hypothetical protein VHH36_00335 [Candidatus Thermoplasmatota archaeon]|nr:hypothetical protein [Candidatus Thermoplasmatota archaeon]